MLSQKPQQALWSLPLSFWLMINLSFDVLSDCHVFANFIKPVYVDFKGFIRLKMVGMEGVEPPRLAALGSKPSVSTSSTTSPD